MMFLAWAVNAGALHNNNSQSQNMFITLHDLWPRIYATDQLQMGFHLKFGNDCHVRAGQTVLESLLALWAQRHGPPGAHMVETVYELEFTMCGRYEQLQTFCGLE